MLNLFQHQFLKSVLQLQVNILCTFAENNKFLKSELFVITPPFTQLNTPYPATAYIKGFLNTKGISSTQADLGIEVILALFSKNGLTDLFHQAELKKQNIFV